MKPIVKVGYALALALILAATGYTGSSWAAPPTVNKHQTPPPILIAEDDFLPSDWMVTAEATGGATFTVTRELTGGYGSPSFRFMSHRLPPVSNGFATIQVTHIFLDDSYDPSVQGPITAIDYQEAGIILSFPFPDAFSTTQPVVVQGGRTFRTRSPKFIRFIAVNGQHEWEIQTLEQLTAADFIAVGGSENEHPDFSENGGPILFGFTRSNSRSRTQPAVPGDQELVIDQGVDHWQIMIHRTTVDEVNQPPRAQDDIFVLDGYRRSLPLFEIFDVVRNDDDPNNDPLEIVEVTEPTFGTAERLTEHTIVYQLEEAHSLDSFSYTITDDVLTDSAQVTVLIDCACTVLCLNTLEVPPVASSTAIDTIDLPLIYRVRDEVLKTTPEGRRYTEMYYTSNPEILANIVMSETLRREAVDTIELWQDPLRSLVEGDGSAIMAQAYVDALQSLLDHLTAGASAGLQSVIATELVRLGPLDEYVGLTVQEAKRRALGDGTLYLPILLQPPAGVSASIR